MYASRANLQTLQADDGAAFRHMWHIGETLSQGLRALFAETETPAIVQNVGPMLQIMFTERPAIHDYREYCAYVDRIKYQKFALALFKYGVYMTPSAALHSVTSLAHMDEDIAFPLDAAREALVDVNGR
jgi:glutamate-1-semialdehyde 2,1-aminomutase